MDGRPKQKLLRFQMKKFTCEDLKHVDAVFDLFNVDDEQERNAKYACWVWTIGKKVLEKYTFSIENTITCTRCVKTIPKHRTTIDDNGEIKTRVYGKRQIRVYVSSK